MLNASYLNLSELFSSYCCNNNNNNNYEHNKKPNTDNTLAAIKVNAVNPLLNEALNNKITDNIDVNLLNNSS